MVAKKKTKKLNKDESVNSSICEFIDGNMYIKDEIVNAQVTILLAELSEYAKLKKAFIEQLLDNRVNVIISYDITERLS